MQTNLANFKNEWYKPGDSFKRLAWILISELFFQHPLALSTGWKCFLLRAFGAKLGKGVMIKPNVTIKYPWFLEIGDYSWIGEHVWLDSLATITIGNNCCISQGALLLTGNHDYTKESFDLIIGKIVLEDGVWIGAKSVVCPGVTCLSHAVLAVGSVATKNLEAYSIYQGNPALFKSKRIIE